MDIKRYRSALAGKGYTQVQLAKKINMAPSTLIRKIRQDSFYLHEMKRMMKILDIKDPDMFSMKTNFTD